MPRKPTYLGSSTPIYQVAHTCRKFTHRHVLSAKIGVGIRVRIRIFLYDSSFRARAIFNNKGGLLFVPIIYLKQQRTVDVSVAQFLQAELDFGPSWAERIHDHRCLVDSMRAGDWTTEWIELRYVWYAVVGDDSLGAWCAGETIWILFTSSQLRHCLVRYVCTFLRTLRASHSLQFSRLLRRDPRSQTSLWVSTEGVLKFLKPTSFVLKFYAHQLCSLV